MKSHYPCSFYINNSTPFLEKILMFIHIQILNKKLPCELSSSHEVIGHFCS